VNDPRSRGPAKVSLDLLGAIAENDGATQRDLSARLGIALGLTNALIKRLARKGYIKVTHVSPRRVRYLLTPKGILEKSRLTYAYIQFSVGYYRDLRERLQALFERLVEDGARRVVLYGAGEVTEIASICLHGTPLELVSVVDDRRAGQAFLGRPVAPVAALKEMAFDALILTVPVRAEAGHPPFERLGVDGARVWGLDASERGPDRVRGRAARGGERRGRGG
jgi:DNA-binding MarR family transcriptional regulator